MSKLQQVKKRLLNARGQAVRQQQRTIRDAQNQFALTKMSHEMAEACEDIPPVPEELLYLIKTGRQHGLAWDPRVKDWTVWNYLHRDGELYRYQQTWSEVKKMFELPAESAGESECP